MKLSLFALALSVFLVSQTNAGELLRYQDAGKATKWDIARIQCQALGTGWDLPTVQDYMELIVAMRSPVQIVPNEAGNRYPMWVRGNSEQENVFMQGSSKLLYMSDGAGFSANIMEATEASADGTYPVRCVTRVQY